METNIPELINLTAAISELSGDISFLNKFLVLYGVTMCAIIYYGIHVYEKNKKNEAAEFSTDKAEQFFNSDKLDSLIDYCEKFYKHYPNDILVNWYLAKAYYRKGEMANARDYFLKVIELNPGWRHSVIPYLEEIDNLSNNLASH